MLFSIRYLKRHEPDLRCRLREIGFLQPFEVEFPVQDAWELCQDLDEKTQQIGWFVLTVTDTAVFLEL